MQIEIPDFCLVALIGASSSGKTTFAKKHFKDTEILSSDYFRALISDDENDQSISKDAFDTLYYIANKRLDNMHLTVIDATNVQEKARKQIIDVAKAQNCHAVAIVLNLPESVCQKRNKMRLDRQVPSHSITSHCINLKKSIKRLKREGFRFVYVLNNLEDLDNVEIVRTKLWNNKKDETGPFDIVGDIHGCYDELVELLGKLEYKFNGSNYYHEDGRKVIFLGDLCDRGLKNMAVLKLVMDMVESGSALCVPGNHDVKLLKKLNGKNVQLSHGFDITLSEIEKEDDEFKEKTKKFIDTLVSHYVMDEGKLVVSHAGLIEKYQGRGSGRVRDFCLYGETTGETDEYGMPVRMDWVLNYRGRATVVYGHTPMNLPRTINNTVCIDTGCVFGGELTCYRYPEREIVSVKAKECYYKPINPVKQEQNECADILNIDDVSGKMLLNTELFGDIVIKEENSTAALEIMSRFSLDPHWLVYLPPTMSPCETSNIEEYLEYPTEAFEYYKNNNVDKVVCEKKHMGSRAVIVMAKDNESALKRFKANENKQGVIYTRTGRSFFDDDNVEKEIIQRLNSVLTENNFWYDFNTDFVVLDTELMPWSEKAQSLIRNQYAPVGVSGVQGLTAAVNTLKEAGKRDINSYDVDALVSGQNVDLIEVLKRYEEKLESINGYVDLYRQYCWTVNDLNDIRIAPFHILATENKVYYEYDHVWHMENIRKYCCGVDNIFMDTQYMVVDVNDDESIKKGVDWWLNLTESGGEGMVVKPYLFTVKNKERLLQPAIKCRGREYLRIIYGPEYTMQEHIKRLKKRSLTRKRQLALREFSLGIESLQRFVNGEPLHKVHACVFGVLALESEPVDARL